MARLLLFAVIMNPLNFDNLRMREPVLSRIAQERDLPPSTFEEAARSQAHLLVYARSILSDTSNYRGIEEEAKERFKSLINNKNNAEALQNRLSHPAGLLQKLELEGGSNHLTKKDILKMVPTIINSFFLNLGEAFQRAEGNPQLTTPILKKSGLEESQLTQINVINESDPHRGGKQACFMCYQEAGRISLQKVKKECTLVYKPRDMRAEASLIHDKESAFSLINELTGQKLLPTYMITCGESFGFTEFIPQTFHLYEGESDTADGQRMNQQRTVGLKPEEVTEFYQQVGRLQFAAQLFGITDLNSSNLIVTGDRRKGYQLCPIDLETSYDIRVLQGNYTTGLMIGLGLSGQSDGNFIVAREGKSPHGHRLTLEDRLAIRNGFNKLKKLLNDQNAINRLLDFIQVTKKFKQRYVPVPTSDFAELNKEIVSFELGEQRFLTLLTEKLSHDAQRSHGTLMIEVNAAALRRKFSENRRNGDIPYFTFGNRKGSLLFDKIVVAYFPPSTGELFNRISSLNSIQIEEAFL